MASIKRISYDYTAPEERKLDGVDFNDAINLLVGENGSGKTFLLVHSFVATYIMKIIELGGDSIAAAQTTCATCFDNFETFTGSFKLSMSNDLELEVKIEEGVVTFCEMTGEGTVTPVVYLSSAMRTFEPIHNYLKIRKGISKHGDQLVPEEFEKILMFFKLYDVSYLEGLIGKCPILLSEAVELFDFGDDYPVKLDVDLDASEFFVKTKEGNTRKLTSYGSGHQAILNMLSSTGESNG